MFTILSHDPYLFIQPGSEGAADGDRRSSKALNKNFASLAIGSASGDSPRSTSSRNSSATPSSPLSRNTSPVQLSWPEQPYVEDAAAGGVDRKGPEPGDMVLYKHRDGRRSRAEVGI